MLTQATAGLSADGRQAVNRARQEASNYKKCVPLVRCAVQALIGCSADTACVSSFYGDSIPGHLLSDRLASYMHVFNLYWHLR